MNVCESCHIRTAVIQWEDTDGEVFWVCMMCVTESVTMLEAVAAL